MTDGAFAETKNIGPDSQRLLWNPDNEKRGG